MGLKKDCFCVFNRTFFSVRSHPFFRAFYIPFLSDHHSTYRRYVILKSRRQKQPRKRTHGWPLTSQPASKYKIYGNQSLFLETAGIYVCLCGLNNVCVRVIWCKRLMNHVKIGPFKDNLSACACLCERRGENWMKCDWQVSAGPVRQYFYLSVCLRFHDYLAVDA